MHNNKKFTPPYPKPHKNKISALSRFWLGSGSWLHTLFEKSYSMKMGQNKLPLVDFFVVNEPKLVKQIMEKDVDDFPKHSLQHEILCPLLGESIFTTNGETWKRQREMMNPSFAHTHLKRAFPNMDDAIQSLLNRIEKLDQSEPIAIDPLMTHITADVIFRTILSHSLSEEEADIVFKNFNIFQDYTQKAMLLKTYKLPAFFYYGKINKASENIRHVLRPLISQRYDVYQENNKDEHNDILASLLKAKDKDGKGFPLDELVNHVAMLFLAGHETTASALTWTLYLLSECPHLQTAILNEVGENKITFEKIKDLKHTRNVFQESLRLYPPVSFFPREATKHCTLRDKSIKPKAMVSISPWLIQRHRKLWTDPDVFDPDRFEDQTQSESIKDAYLPFGKGPRICIGKGFAMQEAILTIANIIQKYQLSNKEGQVPEAMGRVTTRPKEEILLWFKKRA